MGEENLTKICAQCGQEKLLTSQFYRTKNGKDGYMKHCKDCHKANLAASRERERLWWEEWKRKKQEEAVRQAEEAVRQAAVEAHRAVREEQQQRQQAFLQVWRSEQPPRMCIACHTMKPISEFYWSATADLENGFWVPTKFYQRCKSCQDQYREAHRKPCPLCGQGMEQTLWNFDGYTLSRDGVCIELCCTSCEPAFLAMPKNQQQGSIRSRVNRIFPAPQVIYAEIDPRGQQIRYIGRTGDAKRRHGEHKRNVRKEQPTRLHFDREAGRYVDIPWMTRGNWMFELQQLGLESTQRILHQVQPAAYAIEYERRYIWHAIQQGWPILNKEAIIDRERVQASTLDFLSAPFDVLVSEGWFQERAIEAFLRAWYVL